MPHDRQSGYIKIRCVPCEWDSRSQKLVLCEEVVAIACDNLFDSNKMLLPLLHTTLSLTKQCVVVPYTVGDCFNYINRKFTAQMYKKVTELFIELLVRELRTR